LSDVPEGETWAGVPARAVDSEGFDRAFA
jgi:hypothetical protein